MRIALVLSVIGLTGMGASAGADQPAEVLETVDIGGHWVAHVSRAAGTRQLELVTGAAGVWAPLFLATTGAKADAERALHLRVDGHGIVYWQTAPSVVRCDGADQLYVKRWDFGAGGFRQSDPPLPTGEPLTVAATSSLPHSATSFRWVAASASADAEGHADRLAAPVELGDGRVETSWSPGATRAFIVARGPGASVQSLAIAGVTQPLTATLQIDAARAYSLALPVGNSIAQLPAGVRGRCLALTFEGPTRDWSVGEVAIVSEVPSVGTLVSELQSGALGAADAQAELLAAGRQALPEILAALPSARSETAQLRFAELLAGIDRAESTAALVAWLGASPSVAAVVTSALVKRQAISPVAALLTDPLAAPSARVQAALVLGQLADARALTALTAAAGSGAAPLRTAIRDGLSTHPEGRRAAAEALREGGVSAWARVADLARVADFAGGSDAASLVDALDERAMAERSSDEAVWEARLALVRLAGRVGATSVLVRAFASDEPVLRRAALTAAPSAERAPLVARGVVDPDPGVRRTALTLLDGSAPALAAVNDAWPLVRSAAIATLGRSCTANDKSALWSALLAHHDTIALRLEMVTALDHCDFDPAQVARFLTDDEQPARLVASVARRAAQHRQSGPALTRALERVVGRLAGSDVIAPDQAMGDAQDRQAEDNALALIATTQALAVAARPLPSPDRDHVSARLIKLLPLPVTELRLAVLSALGELCPSRLVHDLGDLPRDDTPFGAAARAATSSCQAPTGGPSGSAPANPR